MNVSMNCACTAVNIRTNMKELAKGVNGMSTNTNDIYRSMAEDIKANCEFSECISYDEDDFGKMWLDYICPFYDANDERCKIGDPSTWEL